LKAAAKHHRTFALLDFSGAVMPVRGFVRTALRIFRRY